MHLRSSLALSLLILLNLNPCTAQNIVPDPSFEDYSEPICGIINSAGAFNQIMNSWSSPTSASPQLYFTTIDPTCYNYQPESQYDGPIGIKGDQLPRSGTVMAGLWLYTIDGLNQRHYVQTQLEEPMLPGIDYVVEFYVSLADYMEKYTDRIGAYLSPTPVSLATDSVLPYIPHVSSDGFVDDISNWTRIIDTIQVAEACSYITIGNFYNDSMTNTLPNPSASGAVSTYGAFYFLDDVRVEALNPVGLIEPEDEGFAIYPSHVSDILYIELTQEAEVQIYDTSGRLVYSSAKGIGSHTIDLSNQAQGQYIVTVKHRNGLASSRIIKR